MNWLIGAVPGLVAVFVIVLLVRGYRLMTTEPELDLDDAEALYIVNDARERQASRGPLDRLAASLVPHLRAVLPSGALSWIQEQVDAAGRPDGLDLEEMLTRVARWMVIILPLVVVFFMRGDFVQVALALSVPGLLPLASLAAVARRRREQIDRDLPDFLDVLAVTVSAGLAFRSALAIVAERFGGPLADEVRTVLNQVSNGATVRSAFNGMKTRTRSESVDEFVTAYLQAEELGAPLVDTLNQIAVDMRRAGAQRLRQRAGRMEPRVSLIMTMVLIPGAMIILIGGMVLALDITSVGIFGG